MSEISPGTPPEQVPPRRTGGDYAPSVAARMALWQRAGGVVVPLATVLFAFVMGGLVVLLTTGKNPINTYKEIFQGTGLDWFLEIGAYELRIPGTETTIPFPWNTNDIESQAAFNLQQTLLIWVPLVLTGLAVAFAFRCGMFNIGGQGQYLVGTYAAVYIGTQFAGLGHWQHVVLAITVASIAGALWAGIAGLLKATVGAHEVITTIMLNWIAIFGGAYLVEIGGLLQGPQPSIPRSDTVLESAELWPIWGSLPSLHAGIFIALFALVVYHLILNRTTLGFEVRAVGFNPEAARYGGISVARNYFLALAIAGSFAGLAGSVDLLGFKSAVSTGDFATNLIAFTGIAVALLGRNKAVGILFAALLFAALEVGTSTRQLDPTVFEPELAVDLATMIQALVIFFVGAELLILYIWRARLHLRRTRLQPELKQ